MIALRPFELSDFELLLDLANQAVPFAPRENAHWLAARKSLRGVPGSPPALYRLRFERYECAGIQLSRAAGRDRTLPANLRRM
jgi:hypothetical protein